MRRASGAYGFVLVASGAAIWGSDALFRRGLALELPASGVVFVEHLILAGIMMPWIFRSVHKVRRLNLRDQSSLLIIGAGSSALATVLFTQSFTYGDPTTPLLLQKLQPLFAITAAHILLGETLRPRFGFFLIAALAGAYLVTFADPLRVTFDSAVAAAYALGAAALWAMGTVLGRRLTESLYFAEITAWRFAVGLPAAGLLLVLQGQASVLREISMEDGMALLALALVPGLLALLVYYRGLTTTPASAATVAELAFPAAAVTINWLVFGTVLGTSQWIGLLVLSGVIVTMGSLSRSGPARIGVFPGRRAIARAASAAAR